VAFAAAIDWLEGVGLEAIAEHEADLIRYAADTLGQVPKLHIIGPDTERRSSILSFSIEDVHAHDIADLAGDRGVCIRAGYHCAKPLHDALGLSASCRLSVAAYNSREDIHMLAEALDRGMKILKR
jgi:cysteine desulfurase/selenocysteine lyase